MSQTTLDPIGAVGPDVIPGSKQPRGFLFAFVAAWFGISLVLSTLGGAAIPKVFAFLDDAKAIDAWRERAAWLADEARRRSDGAARAGLLLTVSELWSMTGDESSVTLTAPGKSAQICHA